ncbi:MAG: hypothetical protein KKB21_02250 [Nanoarchaeota archaeon]|nr:hypothetical protein [Nanoarchaeota archaeon]
MLRKGQLFTTVCSINAAVYFSDITIIMGNRIEAFVGNVNLHLVTTHGKPLEVVGTVTLNFECPKCYDRVETTLRYHGKHPDDTERKCKGCGEPYSVINTISITPEIGDRGVVEINRQMKPVLDKIKKDYSQ